MPSPPGTDHLDHGQYYIIKGRYHREDGPAIVILDITDDNRPVLCLYRYLHDKLVGYCTPTETRQEPEYLA